MKYFYLPFFLSMILIVGLINCKEDEMSVNCLLSATAYSSGNVSGTSSYTYNENGLPAVATFESTLEGVTSSKTLSFTYDTQNRLIRVSESDDNYFVINYTDSAINLDYSNYEIDAYSGPFYTNDKGQVIRVSIRRYEYNNAGDLIRSYISGGGEERLSSTYEYADSPNPIKLPLIASYLPNEESEYEFFVTYSLTANLPHNLTRQVSYYANGEINQDDRYEYQYNDQNFPVSASNVATDFEYSYEYENCD